MSFTISMIIFFTLAMIVSGIWLLKKTAKKFHLSEQQLKDIKARNKKLDRKQDD
jgi:flagellar biogenesis protein FliO